MYRKGSCIATMAGWELFLKDEKRDNSIGLEVAQLCWMIEIFSKLVVGEKLASGAGDVVLLELLHI